MRRSKASPRPGIRNSTQITMTPFSHTPFAPSADNTEELLLLIAYDTRRQLRRWTALSVFLRCPLVLSPETRRATLILVNDAVIVLRGMRACNKDALRAFRKRRYDRCLTALIRSEHLNDALQNIDRKAALTVFRFILEGGAHVSRN